MVDIRRTLEERTEDLERRIEDLEAQSDAQDAALEKMDADLDEIVDALVAKMKREGAAWPEIEALLRDVYGPPL